MPYKEMEGLCSFNCSLPMINHLVCFLAASDIHSYACLLQVRLTFPLLPADALLANRNEASMIWTPTKIDRAPWTPEGTQLLALRPREPCMRHWFCRPPLLPMSQSTCLLLHWISWLVLAIAWFGFVWLSIESLNLPFSGQSSHGICLH